MPFQSLALFLLPVFVHIERENTCWVPQALWPLTSNQTLVTTVTLASAQAPWFSVLAANAALQESSAAWWVLTEAPDWGAVCSEVPGIQGP